MDEWVRNVARRKHISGAFKRLDILLEQGVALGKGSGDGHRPVEIPRKVIRGGCSDTQNADIGVGAGWVGKVENGRV